MANQVIHSLISSLNSNFENLIIKREYTHSYTISAGAGIGIKPSDFDVSIPSGYSVLGLIGWRANSPDIHQYRTYLYAGLNSNMLFLENNGSNTYNDDIVIAMAFIRTTALGS